MRRNRGGVLTPPTMPVTLRQIKDELVSYPTLNARKSGKEIHIDGTLLLSLEIEESYHIKIILDEQYPRSYPQIYETKGRIPKTLDRHHFSSEDKSCCLCLPLLFRGYFPEGAKIGVYIEGLVIPYFLNQLHFEIKGFFVTEYSHGAMAYLEFYKDFFKVDSLDKIINILQTMLYGKRSGAAKCPCGKGKTQRKCHLKDMKQALKSYDHHHLFDSFTQLWDLRELCSH